MTSFLSMHSEFKGHGTDTPTLSSSIVVKSLIDAHNEGLKFRVIVVDSRPKLEGKSKNKLNIFKDGVSQGFLHSIKRCAL